MIVTVAGEEAQVDYGSGPMVRDPLSEKYRRTRLFVMTLGNSRKAVRLLVFRSSTRTWAELREKAFRRLGRATKIVILDNLREGGRGCCGSTDSGIVALRRSWSEIFLRKTGPDAKKTNPPPDRPVSDPHAEGSATADSSEPAPSPRTWIFASGATPARIGITLPLPLHCSQAAR